jgi:serine/threonine protein kinase
MAANVQALKFRVDPNIAHIHEIGETDGVKFIVMEYVEGPTLRDMPAMLQFGKKPDSVRQVPSLGIAQASVWRTLLRQPRFVCRYTS